MKVHERTYPTGPRDACPSCLMSWAHGDAAPGPQGPAGTSKDFPGDLSQLHLSPQNLKRPELGFPTVSDAPDRTVGTAITFCVFLLNLTSRGAPPDRPDCGGTTRGCAPGPCSVDANFFVISVFYVFYGFPEVP